jgi:antitoxin MazE
MKTRIVSIGNSLGVRIPKRLLEQTGLHGEVEIRAINKTLVIGPAVKARAGWAAKFREIARRGDDPQ